MTTIYLIRHAEAEGNLYRIAQGQANSSITDRGERQIQALARRFADIPIDAVYASDLYRTCATASAIYKPKGLPLHRRRDLREICVGVWEEKTWGEIARQDPAQLENFNHRLHLWHVEGAETPQAVQTRLLAAVRDIAAANDGKTAAVFSLAAPSACCWRPCRASRWRSWGRRPPAATPLSLCCGRRGRGSRWSGGTMRAI